MEEAKNEVKEREESNLLKWRRMYAEDDENWVYWDKKYYDLVVNTYSNNAKQSLEIVLSVLKKT
jgi:cytidylate kinase